MCSMTDAPSFFFSPLLCFPFCVCLCCRVFIWWECWIRASDSAGHMTCVSHDWSHDLVTWHITWLIMWPLGFFSSTSCWNLLEPSRTFHHGTSWNVIECHGMLWNIMECYGTSWNILEYLSCCVCITKLCMHSLLKLYIRTAVLTPVD